MERTKLKAARVERGLSQSELADAIQCSREAISTWERGTADPHSDTIVTLCTFFDKNPADLDLARALTEDEMRIIEELLRNKVVDRRQAVGIVTSPAFASVDLASLLAPPIVPGAFLNICRVTIENCWYLLDHGDRDKASNILVECAPPLSELAEHSSKYQGLAASLAVEARIIQMAIATSKLDYRGREWFGLEAVRLAKFSHDGDIHAMALGWHGDTYKHCFFQPENAMAHFVDALKCGEISLLNKADIFSGLSLAHALNRNQKKARDYIELAQRTMPIDPESDPLYRCIRTGPSELDQREGRVYLILSQHFPHENYAQMAYDAVEKSLSKPSLSTSHRGLVLIQKARAACALGKFDKFIKAIEEGISIALQFDDKQERNDAQKALHKAPPAWKNEQRYKNLVKMF